ncbi:hypothetical protein MCEMSEM23_00291 [Rhabdaerophilaceae bacterium]
MSASHTAVFGWAESFHCDGRLRKEEQMTFGAVRDFSHNLQTFHAHEKAHEASAAHLVRELNRPVAFF